MILARKATDTFVSITDIEENTYLWKPPAEKVISVVSGTVGCKDVIIIDNYHVKYLRPIHGLVGRIMPIEVPDIVQTYNLVVLSMVDIYPSHVQFGMNYSTATQLTRNHLCKRLVRTFRKAIGVEETNGDIQVRLCDKRWRTNQVRIRLSCQWTLP